MAMLSKSAAVAGRAGVELGEPCDKSMVLANGVVQPAASAVWFGMICSMMVAERSRRRPGVDARQRRCNQWAGRRARIFGRCWRLARGGGRGARQFVPGASCRELFDHPDSELAASR